LNLCRRFLLHSWPVPIHIYLREDESFTGAPLLRSTSTYPGTKRRRSTDIQPCLKRDSFVLLRNEVFSYKVGVCPVSNFLQRPVAQVQLRWLFLWLAVLVGTLFQFAERVYVVVLSSNTMKNWFLCYHSN
jgi:hypothetical protein